MKATHQVQATLSPKLSAKAQEGHVLDGLTTGSLVSIGKLCDDDCIALFTKYNVRIVKNGEVIIEGRRNPNNGLYMIPLSPRQPTPIAEAPKKSLKALSMIRCAKTKADLAAFLHGTLGSPVISTLLRAIKRGHFTHWPGLTEELIRKHLPKSLATAKGHMRGQQQGIASTNIFSNSVRSNSKLTHVS